MGISSSSQLFSNVKNKVCLLLRVWKQYLLARRLSIFLSRRKHPFPLGTGRKGSSQDFKCFCELLSICLFVLLAWFQEEFQDFYPWMFSSTSREKLQSNCGWFVCLFVYFVQESLNICYLKTIHLSYILIVFCTYKRGQLK